MKSFRYTRDLDGAPEGAVRPISADEAAPLLKSGAIVEVPIKTVAPPPPPAPAPSQAPPASDAPPVSVTVEPKPARVKPAKPAN